MARRSNQKRRTDPNAPKKNKTAWRLYFSENLEEVKKQNPNLKYIDIRRKLGEMWRQCDDDTKRRYQKQSQTDQAEYEEKLAAYKNEQKKNRQSKQTDDENNEFIDQL